MRSLNSKQQAMLWWFKSFGPFTSLQIMGYGADNGYLRADRDVRDFVKDPDMPLGSRPLTPAEKKKFPKNHVIFYHTETERNDKFRLTA